MHWLGHNNHEPAALAALVATSLSLHATWISNLYFFRVHAEETLGSIYLFVGGVWVVAFVLAFVWFRAHDGGHAQVSRVLHLFLASVFLFLMMTFPFVYGFAV